MKLLLETNKDGNLVLRQDGFKISRYIIGATLFLMGTLLVHSGIMAPITATQKGASMPNALLSMVVMLFFAAIALPMGWWMLFSRFWIVIDTALQQVTEVSDWKLGRRYKMAPIENFQSLRLAVEHLSGDPNRRNRRSTTFVQMVRLLAKDPLNQHSIELGWLDMKDRARAEEFIQEVSRYIKLPVLIVPGDDAVPTPTEDLMMQEEAEEDLEHEKTVSAQV